MFQKQKLKNKDIDLLKVYSRKDEPSKSTLLAKMLMIPLLGFIVFGSLFGYFTYKNYKYQNDIKDMKTEVAKTQKKVETNPQLEEYKTLQEAQNNVKKYETLYGNIVSYPQISQGVFDNILLATNLKVSVTSLSYVRESQVITLQIEGPTASDTEMFVRRLKETSIFASVTYDGYSRVEKSNTEQSKEPVDKTSQQALLEALLAKSDTTKAQEKTTTTAVYTASVLCTLK
ncbi:MAG: hypothetical protein RR766_01585 [Longicatena sp.]